MIFCFVSRVSSLCALVVIIRTVNEPVRFLAASILTLTLLLVSLFAGGGVTASPSPVTLVFVGDVMLGRGVAASLGGDWAAAFADLRPWLAGADLAMANLESPLTRAPFAGGRFDLRASPEAVTALTAAGFDVVSLANNHALDGGEAGLAETLDTLQVSGIVAVTDPNMVESSPLAPGSVVTLDVGDLRTAVLAYVDVGGQLDTTRIAQAADEVDLVVVLVHWGAEYFPVTARQRTLAHSLAAAGADLIVGQGPHVLQPVEEVDGALVAYSLGNFLFDQPFPNTRQGAILRVTLHGDGTAAVEAIPTLIGRGRVHLASGADAAAIQERLRLPPSSSIWAR
jgi:poly-gamma-glutamate synthesis protein (capsule biosynthesis protein)